MNAAITTVEASDKYLPILKSLRIVRTKTEIIMNKLKMYEIERVINISVFIVEGSQFFSYKYPQYFAIEM